MIIEIEIKKLLSFLPERCFWVFRIWVIEGRYGPIFLNTQKDDLSLIRPLVYILLSS